MRKSGRALIRLSATLVAIAAHAEDVIPPAVIAPTRTTGITVVAGELDDARNGVSPSLGASTYELGSRRFATQAQGADASFNQTLLRAPGIAQDSFGQLHLRGEHANLQYRINDVLLPEGISGFGQELDTRFADRATLITGSLPAQYGFRTAGVIDIQTRSGSRAPGAAVSVFGGSHDTVRPAVEFGGAQGDVEVYATASYLHSELGIENPTDDDAAVHDRTDQFRGFAYGSWYPDAQSRLSVIASASDSRFEIPNNPDQEPAFVLTGTPAPDSRDLDERQRETNSYGVLAYQRAVATVDMQVAGFVRSSGVRFTPDRAGDLIYNGVASSADLGTRSLGSQVDGSVRLSDQHTLRGGASVLVQRAVSESTTLVFPVDPVTGDQSGTDPLAIDDDRGRTGSFTGVYLQDEWRITARWTVNAGLRVDRVQAYVHEGQLSPRLNTTVRVTDATTVHAGYARYFTPPPLESVPQETIAKFAGTTNAAAVEANDPVRSERSHYVDAGVTQKFSDAFQVGLDGYYKRARHQLDDGQFGSAVIFTPFNYSEGTVYGTELTATYQDERLLTYANVALSKAVGRDIESAQFEFDPDELAYIRDHDVLLDHDQRWTASLGASYAIIPALTIGLDGLFGSGLRKGFANRDKVAAYYTVNPGIAYTRGGLTARFDVINVLDRSYQLRDGSGIGVGAPQFGQRRGLYGGLTYDF